MPIHITRPSTSLLLTTLAAFLIPAAPSAQTPVPAPPAANPDAVKLFQPAPPLPSYEVATIKKADPNAAPAAMAMAAGRGGGPRPGQQMGDGGQTIKSYILSAYGASTRSEAQVVGGPSWLSTDRYVIQARSPDDLHDAMQKTTQAEQTNQTRRMQQSLLADRFHLKAHIETRQLPIFELTAAKGGLKFKQLAPSNPGDPSTPPSTRGRLPIPIGMIVSMPKPGGGRLVSMHATTMSSFIDFLRRSPDIGGRPILDKTGFTGTFDVTDLDWSVGSADAPEAPSLFTSITENLGLKLITTEGPVEVLVIDSIDRPSPN